MANTVIEFEGEKIKPSAKGVYRCPFKCHSGAYAAPKWKTEAGFIKHLTSCSKRPSNVKRLAENKEIEDMIFEGVKKKALELVKQKIGDTIFWIKKIVVKDTHEYRNGRHVRVRYEQVLRFEAVQSKVEKIEIINRNNYAPSAEYLLSNCLFFNGGIALSSLRDSLKDAQDDAKLKTVADEKYRNEASSFR